MGTGEKKIWRGKPYFAREETIGKNRLRWSEVSPEYFLSAMAILAADFGFYHKLEIRKRRK